jgi:hypothetical protein
MPGKGCPHQWVDAKGRSLLQLSIPAKRCSNSRFEERQWRALEVTKWGRYGIIPHPVFTEALDWAAVKPLLESNPGLFLGVSCLRQFQSHGLEATFTYT